MDGPHLSPSIRSPARALLVAVLTLLLATAFGAATAAADDVGDPAPAPQQRWPVGGTALRTAMGLATEHWGTAACGGRVTVRWVALSPSFNAQSIWANDVDPYLQPSRNTECELDLSTAAEWDWPKLCTVVVHEAGHLTGHDHVDDPRDIMFAVYMDTVDTAPECAATPEPVQEAPAASTATVPAAAPAAVRSKPVVKPVAKPTVKATRAPKHTRRRAPARRRAHAVRGRR